MLWNSKIYLINGIISWFDHLFREKVVMHQAYRPI